MCIFNDAIGHVGCGLSEEINRSLKNMEVMPSDKVHDLCPLKNHSYKFKLKDGNN